MNTKRERAECSSLIRIFWRADRPLSRLASLQRFAICWIALALGVYSQRGLAMLHQITWIPIIEYLAVFLLAGIFGGGAWEAGLAFLLGLVQSFFLIYFNPSYTLLAVFAILYAVLLVSPKGLFGKGV